MKQEDWALLDRQALGVVRLSLAKNIAVNIVNEKNTFGLLKDLSNMYEKPSALNNVFLIRQLVNTKMTKGATCDNRDLSRSDEYAYSVLVMVPWERMGSPTQCDMLCGTFWFSLLLTPLCCDDTHDVTPRVSALAGCDRLVSEPGILFSCLSLSFISTYGLLDIRRSRRGASRVTKGGRVVRRAGGEGRLRSPVGCS
ncbi:hypothetical protein Tco_0231449 [Tanacetum coccineum]